MQDLALPQPRTRRKLRYVNQEHRATHHHARSRGAIAAAMRGCWCIVIVACGGKSLRISNADEPASAFGSDHRLPTGARLDPAGHSFAVGNMPIAVLPSPDGKHLVLSLAGWREQGLEIVDRSSDTVVERMPQRGAFFGLAWSV